MLLAMALALTLQTVPAPQTPASPAPSTAPARPAPKLYNESADAQKAIDDAIAAAQTAQQTLAARPDYYAALIKVARGAKVDSDALARTFLDGGFACVAVENGYKKVVNYGKKYINFGLSGLKYTVSPRSFFQSNWSLNQEVVRLAIEGLQPLEGRRVLDLYSGAGNFSLPIAGHALEVVAVEENPDAVEDGERNLRLNGVQNMRLVRSRADSPDLEFHADVVVADPPRTGLGPGVAERLLDLSPEKVLYVSCDPATLARDLKKLSAGYELESVRMVDFFPQTYHIESLTFLTRRH